MPPIEGINLGPIDKVEVYSDLHFSPLEMTQFGATQLYRRSWRNQPQGVASLDQLTNQPPSGTMRFLGGDIFHIYPLVPWERAHVDQAWYHFAEAIDTKDDVGTHTKFILGNHTPLSHIPPEISQFLEERHILVPEDRIDFQNGGMNFSLMHGDRAQPGFYAYPLGDNPYVQKLSRKILDLFRLNHRIGKNELTPPDIYRSTAFFASIMNGFQKKWKSVYIPEEDALITGHTHVAEVDPEHNYYNPGYRDVLFRYLSSLMIENGHVELRYQEI